MNYKKLPPPPFAPCIHNNKYTPDPILGLVYSSVRQRYLIGAFTLEGYHRTKCGPNKKFLYTHRVIAENCVPNPEKKPIVHHINFCPWDNRAENLMWVTHEEYERLKYENGLKLKEGERLTGFFFD